ncbi:MAG: [acyl-carrier-protein] S-malonyltransferase [Desulfotalea sp.]|nr:MAG: [acyl-carrier-protein] S-malonyltransferase [Desulfotalea sp.]
MKIAVLFPGQGSQYLGMAKEFVHTKKQCAGLMEMAETVCDLNLQELCDQGPLEELTRATNLQPAITIANLICWQAFIDETQGEIEVSSFAGHSLGEYSALYAAGVINAKDAIRLVSKRGALMEREGLKNPGGMRAVLGLGIDVVEGVIAAYTGDGVVTAANHNTPQQVVVSGSIGALDWVTAAVEELGGRVITLNVSVANHSPLVAEAVPDFAEFMADTDFNIPKIPIYFNVTADKETDPNKMKGIMASQIESKVRWCEIITAMVDDGVDTFIEVGPKTVLKGMMKKITPKGTKVTSLQFDCPESLEKCLQKLRQQ